jgi:hypothetical protein
MSTTSDELRGLARKRLEARRAFESNLIAFVVVNAAIVAIWWSTGRGYFWPGWVLGLWGVGVALHAWETFGRRPITEEDVEREARRLGR